MMIDVVAMPGIARAFSLPLFERERVASQEAAQQMTDSTMTPPGYPSAAGLRVPDLDLAGISTPKTDLSGGNFAESTPPQQISYPPLRGSLAELGNMGADPEVQYPATRADFNFAGANGFPSPSELTRAAPYQDERLDPTFILPDYSTPALKPGDLTGPGIDMPAAFTPDPVTGDLLQFCTPVGLDITAGSRLTSDEIHQPDPIAPDLGEYDRPDGLVMPEPMTVDPSLPDLQSPTFEQAVHMDMRPGEMAPDALDISGDDDGEDALDPSGGEDEDYPESQLDAGGTRRARHMSLVRRGLDGVGGGHNR